MSKRKIRCHNKLAQLLCRRGHNTMTPDEIFEILRYDPACVSNCQRTWDDPNIPMGPKKLGRMSIWISNLISEKSWNKGRGGADIYVTKKGKDVISYTLKNPEIFNVFGFVMHTDEERFQDKVVRDRIFSSEMSPDPFPLSSNIPVLAFLEKIKHQYDSYTDKKGRVVPNDPITGEIIWDANSRNDFDLTLDDPDDEKSTLDTNPDNEKSINIDNVDVVTTEDVVTTNDNIVYEATEDEPTNFFAEEFAAEENNEEQAA